MSLQLNTAYSEKSDLVILPFSKINIDRKLIKDITGINYDIDFSANSKESLFTFHAANEQKICLLGLGEANEIQKIPGVVRSLIFQQRTKKKLTIDIATEHLPDAELLNVVIGVSLSLMNHGVYKTNGSKFEEPDLHIIINEKKRAVAEQGLIIADSMMTAMKLVDLPSNIKTPEYIGHTAKKSGEKYGFDVRVIEKEELIKMGMDALLAVGQGSNNPPVFIIMEYKPEGSSSNVPKLGLVGKGISFDTGGISIKPSANMGYMKSDMGGAAAVIGAIELAAKLKLNIHVVGIVPSAENSVDAASIRPGDVINSYSGKSIEVIDTDAEGRLVLADGLAYMVKHFKPEYMIDLATLTGSIIASLGYFSAGLFTKNDTMAADIIMAGEGVNERLWRMPLWDDYMAEMQSDIADVKNLSGKPVAGSITAAKFVEYFTAEHTNWAHIDIAGVAFSDSEYAKMRTATAYGVRLLVNYMEMLIKK